MLVAPLQHLAHIPTLAIEGEVRERVRLGVDPVVGDDVGVGVAQLVLHQHVDAVPQVDPPQAAVPLRGLVRVAVGFEGHLAQLVEAVEFVGGVERGDIGVGPEVPVRVCELGDLGGVFAEGEDVGAADGEDVFARKVGCPSSVGLGTRFKTAEGWVVAGEKRAVELHVVQGGFDVLKYRRCIGQPEI